jgi:hypothetical protein
MDQVVDNQIYLKVMCYFDILRMNSNLTSNLEVLVVFNGVDQHFPQNKFYNYCENWT